MTELAAPRAAVCEACGRQDVPVRRCCARHARHLCEDCWRGSPLGGMDHGYRPFVDAEGRLHWQPPPGAR